MGWAAICISLIEDHWDDCYDDDGNYGANDADGQYIMTQRVKMSRKLSWSIGEWLSSIIVAC